MSGGKTGKFKQPLSGGEGFFRCEKPPFQLIEQMRVERGIGNQCILLTDTLQAVGEVSPGEG